MLDIKLEIVVSNEDGDYIQLIRLQHDNRSMNSPKFRTDYSEWMKLCTENYKEFENDDYYALMWEKIEGYKIEFLTADMRQKF